MGHELTTRERLVQGNCTAEEADNFLATLESTNEALTAENAELKKAEEFFQKVADANVEVFKENDALRAEVAALKAQLAEGLGTADEIKMLPDGRMSTRDAARYLGLAEKTLAMKRLAGTGPAFVKRGLIFYFQSDLDAWLQEGRVPSKGEPCDGR